MLELCKDISLSLSGDAGGEGVPCALLQLLELLQPRHGREHGARVAAAWPVSADSLASTLVSLACSPPSSRVQTLACRALGRVLHVTSDPERTRRVLCTAATLLHSGVAADAAAGCSLLSAIDVSLRRSGSDGAPRAYWSFPGWDGSGLADTGALRAGSMTLPLVTRWPFDRGAGGSRAPSTELGIFVPIRVAAWDSGWAGSGVRACPGPIDLFHVVTSGGAELRIWLEPHAVVVRTHEPPAANPSGQSRGGGGGEGGGGNALLGAAGAMFGVAARSVMSHAAAAVQELSLPSSRAPASGALSGTLSGAATSGSGSSDTWRVAVPCMEAGRWVSLYVHFCSKRGLLGNLSSEASVFCDGVLAGTTTGLTYPRGLAASPLIIFRMGHCLTGEMGPVYLWGAPRGGSGSVCGPLSGDAQRAITRAHARVGNTLVAPSVAAALAAAAAAAAAAPLRPALDLCSEAAADGLASDALPPPPWAIFHPAVGAGVHASLSAEVWGSGEEGKRGPWGVGSGEETLSGAPPPSAAAAYPSISTLDGPEPPPVLVTAHGVTSVVDGCSASHALEALGGVGALLPLLTAAAAGAAGDDVSLSEDGDDVEGGDAECGVGDVLGGAPRRPSPATLILRILASVLRTHPSSCASALADGLVPSLRLHLVACLATGGASAADALFPAALDDFVGACVDGNAALGGEALRLLLAWPSLWAQADVSRVQAPLLRALAVFARDKPTILVEALGGSSAPLLFAIAAWFRAATEEPGRSDVGLLVGAASLRSDVEEAPVVPIAAGGGALPLLRLALAPFAFAIGYAAIVEKTLLPPVQMGNPVSLSARSMPLSASDAEALVMVIAAGACADDGRSSSSSSGAGGSAEVESSSIAMTLAGCTGAGVGAWWASTYGELLRAEVLALVTACIDLDATSSIVQRGNGSISLRGAGNGVGSAARGTSHAIDAALVHCSTLGEVDALGASPAALGGLEPCLAALKPEENRACGALDALEAAASALYNSGSMTGANGISPTSFSTITGPTAMACSSSLFASLLSFSVFPAAHSEGLALGALRAWLHVQRALPALPHRPQETLRDTLVEVAGVLGGAVGTVGKTLLRGAVAVAGVPELLARGGGGGLSQRSRRDVSTGDMDDADAMGVPWEEVLQAAAQEASASGASASSSSSVGSSVHVTGGSHAHAGGMTAYRGAAWAQAFARAGGFVLLTQLLLRRAPLGSNACAVLAEALFLPDPTISLISAHEDVAADLQSITRDGGDSDHALLLKARAAASVSAVSTLAACEHAVSRTDATARGICHEAWWWPVPLPSCGESPPLSLPERTPLSAPALFTLVLRLLPRLEPSTSLRALSSFNISLALSAASRAAVFASPLLPDGAAGDDVLCQAVGCAVGWECALAFFIASDGCHLPATYQSQALSTAASLSPDTHSVARLHELDSYLARLHTGEDIPTSPDTEAWGDALYMAGERLLLLLLHCAMSESPDGWRPLHRLCSLRPLFEGSDTTMEMKLPLNVPVATLSPQARHARRLIVVALARAFSLGAVGSDSGGATPSLVSLPLLRKNLTHLTAAALDGELPAELPSSLGGAAPPPPFSSGAVLPCDLLITLAVCEGWDCVLDPDPTHPLTLALLHQTSSDFPLSGNLRSMLLAATLRLLSQLPPDHPAMLHCLVRLGLLLRSLLQRAEAAAAAAAAAAELSPPRSPGSSSAAHITGVAAPSSEWDSSSWVHVVAPGRSGIAPCTWVSVAVGVLHTLLNAVRIASAAGGSDEAALRATADLACSNLRELVATCPFAVAAAASAGGVRLADEVRVSSPLTRPGGGTVPAATPTGLLHFLSHRRDAVGQRARDDTGLDWLWAEEKNTLPLNEGAPKLPRAPANWLALPVMTFPAVVHATAAIADASSAAREGAEQQSLCSLAASLQLLTDVSQWAPSPPPLAPSAKAAGLQQQRGHNDEATQLLAAAGAGGALELMHMPRTGASTAVSSRLAVLRGGFTRGLATILAPDVSSAPLRGDLEVSPERSAAFAAALGLTPPLLAAQAVTGGKAASSSKAAGTFGRDAFVSLLRAPLPAVLDAGAIATVLRLMHGSGALPPVWRGGTSQWATAQARGTRLCLKASHAYAIRMGAALLQRLDAHTRVHVPTAHALAARFATPGAAWWHQGGSAPPLRLAWQLEDGLLVRGGSRTRFEFDPSPVDFSAAAYDRGVSIRAVLSAGSETATVAAAVLTDEEVIAALDSGVEALAVAAVDPSQSSSAPAIDDELKGAVEGQLREGGEGSSIEVEQEAPPLIVLDSSIASPPTAAAPETPLPSASLPCLSAGFFAALPGETLVAHTPCVWVTLDRPLGMNGELFVSNLALYFRPDETSEASVASAAAERASADNASPRVFRIPPPAMPQRWSLALLSSLLPRRHLLLHSAMELVFCDGVTAFIALAPPRDSPAHRIALVEAIVAQRPPRLLATLATTGLRGASAATLLDPIRILQSSGLTERWVNRKCSNFEYLMALNALTRSSADLSQYPVMPWVLSDYTSSHLDLSDPAIYRDLSKPMGALTPKRRRTCQERFEGMRQAAAQAAEEAAASAGASGSSSGGASSFLRRRGPDASAAAAATAAAEGGASSSTPPFMYGSHYSSPGIVLFYLLRVEPFTSLAVELQGGRFDVPDRLFFSLPQCWHGCTHSLSDVKELIPELYTTPSVLVNVRKLPLGTLQPQSDASSSSSSQAAAGGASAAPVPVDDVVLPPWASSAEEFIWTHRAALESEHVSASLHAWIDLIWGVKQRGPASIEADNVFFYLTYEGALRTEQLSLPQRTAMSAQLMHYGQTPQQLFKSPHPQRAAQSSLSAQILLPLFAFERPPGHSVLLQHPARPDAAGRSHALAAFLHARLGLEHNAEVGTVARPAGSAPALLSGIDLSDSAVAAGWELSAFTALVHPRDAGTAAAQQAAVRAAAAVGDGDVLSSKLAAARRIPLAATTLAEPGRAITHLSILPSAGPPGSTPHGAFAVFDASVQAPGGLGDMGSGDLFCLAVHGDAAVALHKWAPHPSADGALPYTLKGDARPGRLPLGGIALSTIARGGPGCGVAAWPVTVGALPRDPHALFPTLVAAAGLLHADSDVINDTALSQIQGLLAQPQGLGLPFLSALQCAVAAPVWASSATGSNSGGNSNSAQVDSPERRAARPLLFTAGYADGGLRWGTLSGGGRGGPFAGHDAALPQQQKDSGASIASFTAVTALSSACDDPHTLVTGHADGRVNLWRLFSSSVPPQELQRAADAVHAATDTHARASGHAMSSNAALPILRGATTGSILLQVTSCMSALAPQLVDSAHGPAITAVSARLASACVAGGTLDGRIALWDALSGVSLRIITPTHLLRELSTTSAVAPALLRLVGGASVTPPPLLPVQGIHLLPNGHIVAWWSTVAVDSGPHSLLLAFTVNGMPTGALAFGGRGESHEVRNGGWVTSLATTREGSAVCVGLSSGALLVAHGLTLDTGGWLPLHTHLTPNDAATAAAALVTSAVPANAVTSSSFFSGLRSKMAAATAGGGSGKGDRKQQALVRGGSGVGFRMPSRHGSHSSSLISSSLRGADAWGGANVPLPPPPPPVLPATAITSLSFAAYDTLVLAGCGDGRVVIVADQRAASVASATALTEGLFGLG